MGKNVKKLKSDIKIPIINNIYPTVELLYLCDPQFKKDVDKLRQEMGIVADEDGIVDDEDIVAFDKR